MREHTVLEAEHVKKSFEDLEVIDDVSLEVAKGEFVVLLGPSGCGKSTFLSLAAGLERPTEGSIRVFGKEVLRPSRTFGFVFQDYALFPWKTVFGNVESGLRDRSKAERRDIAEHYIERVGLSRFRDTYPHQLSGGMKQRVGIARALAYDPQILLMDEPFGALDAQTRKYMQQELRSLLESESKTILFVTHSVIEAVYLADRVIVFGQRPARIIYEEAIEIEGERHYTGEAFNTYREEILEKLDPLTGVRS